MAAGQLGKGFPGELEEMPAPPYSRGSWWWRPGPANLIYCHRVPSQRGQLRSQLVTRHYVMLSLAKEESEYVAGAPDQACPWQWHRPGSGGWVITIMLGLPFSVGQLLLSLGQSFDLDAVQAYRLKREGRTALAENKERLELLSSRET